MTAVPAPWSTGAASTVMGEWLRNHHSRPHGFRSCSRLGLLISVLACLTAAAVSMTPLTGQATTHLSRCATCEIELAVSRVASLGAAADPFSPAERPHHVVHDRHDRYFVMAGFPVDRILVYKTGGGLDAVWGRGGEGPGEYQSIRQLLLLRGDSLGVVDDVGLRLTVLDADGSAARTQPLPFHPFRIVQLDNGSLVMAGLDRTAGGGGYVMHLIRPDGSVSPFGPEGTVLRSRPSASQRHLAAAGKTVWAARPDRYELTEFALDGTPLRVLRRAADWFPDRDYEGTVSIAEAPSPYLVALRVDEKGRIWTMVRLADTDWAPSDASGTYGSYGRHYDSVVEVIDPDRGLVVKSQRFGWYGHGFTNDGLFVSHREDVLGIFVLDIWRVTPESPAATPPPVPALAPTAAPAAPRPPGWAAGRARAGSCGTHKSCDDGGGRE